MAGCKGKKILRVHYSHGRGDIAGKVTDKIRGQVKLSQKDFKELIGCCPLSYEDYIKILKQKGFIRCDMPTIKCPISRYGRMTMWICADL